MSETSHSMTNLRWFLSGCLVTFVVLAIIEPQLHTQNSGMAATISQLRAQTADLIKQRDACNAKFDRVTILYDVGLFNIETRAWVIPADVEPLLAPNKTGTYSHYDPKTQIETVHFRGKVAQ